ncbi:MAG: universal stress protein [Nitrosopumilus sp.]
MSSSEGIASYADGNNVDLIVIGSHGRTVLERLF